MEQTSLRLMGRVAPGVSLGSGMVRLAANEAAGSERLNRTRLVKPARHATAQAQPRVRAKAGSWKKRDDAGARLPAETSASLAVSRAAGPLVPDKSEARAPRSRETSSWMVSSRSLMRERH